MSATAVGLTYEVGFRTHVRQVVSDADVNVVLR